jgi:hypothetical protein
MCVVYSIYMLSITGASTEDFRYLAKKLRL